MKAMKCLVLGLACICVAAAAHGAVDGYVQSGLIAHWDAIDNVGTGVHDASATTWKDLTGLHADMVFPNGTLIGENYYDMKKDGVSGGTGGYVTNIADIATAIINKACTIEIVCDFRSQVDDGTVFCCYESSASKRLLWVRSNNGKLSAAANGCIGSAEYCWSSGNGNVFKFDNGYLNQPRIYAFGCNGGTVTVYKNGMNANLSIPSSSLSSVTAQNAWFCIGRRYAASSPSTAVADMKVYSIRIYNRVLSPAEILANSKTDSSRFGIPIALPAKKSSQDYVQNGLIAQWDGIENAGRGRRKDDATTWKDLTGLHSDMVFPYGTSIGENYYDMKKSGVSGGTGGYVTNIADIATAILDKNCTVEIACDFRSQTEGGTIFCCYDTDTTKRLLWAFSMNGAQDTLAKGCLGFVCYVDRGDVSNRFKLDNGSFNQMRIYAIKCNGGTASIYRNGMDTGLSATAGSLSGVDVSKAWFCIGCRYGATSSSTAIADMNVYAVRVYNRQLSDDELAANAAADNDRFVVGQYVAPNKAGLIISVR